MHLNIVTEFCERKQFNPVIFLPITKRSQVLLLYLVDPFCLPISLWVEHCRSLRINIEQFLNVSPEVPNEDGISIWNNASWQAVKPPDLINKPVSKFYSGLPPQGYKVGHFGKVIYYYPDLEVSFYIP